MGNVSAKSVTWGRFAVFAIILAVPMLAISGLYRTPSWPNGTTALLGVCTVSVVGYLALGWRRLRFELTCIGNGPSPTPERVKSILLGPKPLLWIWAIATLIVALSIALFLDVKPSA
jgi:hypothetical protein